MKFFELFEKRLTIGYIKKFLHKKGIATSDIDDKTVSFKLYDYDWFIYYEADRLRLSIYIDIDPQSKDRKDVRDNCSAINNSCWMVRCRIAERKEKDSPITRYYQCFYCEFICDSRKEFEKFYKFSLVALVDAIKMSTALYVEPLPF